MWACGTSELSAWEKSSGRTGGVQSEMLPLGIEEQRIGALGFEGILFNILTSAHYVHIILYWVYNRCSIIIDNFSFITHHNS